MPLSPGAHLGPYEILAPLGAGGMGEVYRALDPRLRREVAIKVIPAGLARDPERLRRFDQEARAAGQLNHPNVLAIFDLGSYEGAPFVVSELLEGETLRERLEAGTLPPRRAVDYASQITRGLAAAHEKGIVHRDLKPENLFVTRDGRVKILDFGLAKLVVPTRGAALDARTVTANLTDSGVILGTVGYMAPEQVRGEPADARADLFAFGCVLYEMLAHRRAFHAASAVETMSAILNSDPPALAELRPDHPPALDSIVHHCLEKQPGNRFQSARDIEFALVALTSLSGPGAAKAGKRPRWAGRMIQALVLLLVAGAVAVASWVTGLSRHVAQPSFQRLSFRRGFISSARFAPDGHTIVYSAAFDGGPVRLYSTRTESPESGPLDLPEANLLSISSSGTVALSILPHLLPPIANFRGTLAQAALAGGAPREMLENVTWADWSPDGASLAAVHVLDGPDRLEFPVSHVAYRATGGLSHPRVSSDGVRVAFIEHLGVSGEDRGNVMLLDRNGRVSALASGWQSVQGLAWAPNGREIWFSAARMGNARDLWGVTPSGRLRLILRMAGGLTLHDISRDGRVLLARENFRDGILALIPGESRERDLSWLDWSDVADISADGKTVLFTEMGEGAGSDYAVCLRGTNGSPVVRLGNGSATALSPDGRWVIAVAKSPAPHVVLLPTHAGQSRSLDPGPLRSIAWATWFPDSRRIAINGGDGVTGRAYVQSIDGGAPRPLTPPGTEAGRVTPDGRFVVNRDSLIALDGSPSVSMHGVEPGDLAIHFSVDGRKLFVWRWGELPSKIYRIELASGRREVWRVLMPADPSGILGIGPVTITPDGQTCVYTYGRQLSDLYLVSGLK